jgi:hypothetical protein
LRSTVARAPNRRDAQRTRARPAAVDPLFRLARAGSHNAQRLDRLGALTHHPPADPGYQDAPRIENGAIVRRPVCVARTSKAVATNPALAAVIGGMNPPQAIVAGGNAMPTNSMGVPWNASYIVASGNLLADFRANVNAEAQGRLQISRLFNMTDDSGVREMFKFNLARDTFH